MAAQPGANCLIHFTTSNPLRSGRQTSTKRDSWLAAEDQIQSRGAGLRLARQAKARFLTEHGAQGRSKVARTADHHDGKRPREEAFIGGYRLQCGPAKRWQI